MSVTLTAGPCVRLEDVFGLNESRNVLSYVERDVEREFAEALRSEANNAIVIYGTSKQGKTSLRRSQLPDSSCIILSCTRDTGLEAVYREALSQAGARIKDGNVVEYEGELQLEVGGGLLAAIGMGKVAGVGKRKSKAETKSVQVDWGYAETVARVLAEIRPNAVVVIDNFHYFDVEIQSKFATDLRAFGQRGIKFVILGTWKDKDYLLSFNADLKRRVANLSIEPWSDADLRAVIDKGERELGVRVLERIKSSFIKRCEGNIGLLQTFLKEFLRAESIGERPRETVELTNFSQADAVARNECGKMTSQVTTDFGRLATEIGGAWLKEKTRMFWIIDTILECSGEEIKNGIPYKALCSRVSKKLASVAPRKTISEREFGKLIKKDLLHFQQDKMATPFIAYDAGADSVIILDSWTRFVLKMERHVVRRGVNRIAERLVAD
jgi:hypothetical protein